MGRAFFTSIAFSKSAAAARRRAKSIAATALIAIDDRFHGGHHEIVLTAPGGYRFESGVHERVLANAGPTTDGLWEATLDALHTDPIELCDDAECEWCHPEADE